MLAVGGQHFVLRGQTEAGEDDVAPVRGRGRQREVRFGHADHGRELRPDSLAQLDRAREVVRPAPASLEIGFVALRHRGDRRGRQRAVRARVQVGEALEHGELPAGFVDGHSIVTSTGAWSDRSRPSRRLRSSGQRCACPEWAPRTRIWSIPEIGRENAQSGPVSCSSVFERSRMTLKSPARASASSGSAKLFGEDRRPQELAVGDAPVGHARIVQVRDGEVPLTGLAAHRVADPPLLRPGEPDPRVQFERARLQSPEPPRVEDDRVARERPKPVAEQDRVRLTSNSGAKEPVVKLGDAGGRAPRSREVAARRPPRTSASRSSRPGARAPRPEAPGGTAHRAGLRSPAAPSPSRSCPSRAGSRCRGRRSRCVRAAARAG